MTSASAEVSNIYKFPIMISSTMFVPAPDSIIAMSEMQAIVMQHLEAFCKELKNVAAIHPKSPGTSETDYYNVPSIILSFPGNIKWGLKIQYNPSINDEVAETAFICFSNYDKCTYSEVFNGTGGYCGYKIIKNWIQLRNEIDDVSALILKI